MKLPVIIAVFVVSLGVSFAAGGYFAPSIFRVAPFARVFSAPNPPAQATGNPAPVLPMNSGSATAQPSGSAPGDLPSILKETNSYRQIKDLTAYAEGISAADMPNEMEKVQSLQNGNQYQA